jgi:hypothetical protein
MVVLSDGTIVKMGGGNGNETDPVYYNDTWKSIDKGETWQLVNASSGWSPRGNAIALALPDDNIVLIGGNIFNDFLLNDVWLSPDGGETWIQQTASAEWSARKVATAVSLADGNIVLMGGWDGSSQNDTWWSDNKGESWTLVNTNAGWAARYSASSAAMPDGSIVMLGGMNSNGILSDVWRSTDEGETWTQVNPNAFSPRATPGIAVTSDGSLVVIEGLNTSQNHPHDVWRLQAGSTVQNPSHTYTTPGTYQVTLQAYNADGFTRKTGTITVTPTIAPVANFTGTPTTGTAPLTVTFTDWSTNGPTSWNWSFGDGTFSSQKNATHVYTTSGMYTVSLNASNSAGFDTFTRSGYITVTTVTNGTDTVGVYRNGRYYLRNSNTGGVSDISFIFGQTGDLPVTGDWNG